MYCKLDIYLETKVGCEDGAPVPASNVGLTISLDFLKRPGLPSPAPSSPGDATAGDGLLTLILRAASSLILRTLLLDPGEEGEEGAAEASFCSLWFQRPMRPEVLPLRTDLSFDMASLILDHLFPTHSPFPRTRELRTSGALDQD